MTKRQNRRLLKESWWFRLRQRRALMALGGLGVGALGVGIALLLLQFVIQPLCSPATRGYTTYRGEHFTLWYDDASPHRSDHLAMLAQLEREYADLATIVGSVNEESSQPMDVFIHDTISMMQDSIRRRKSHTSGTVFHRAFDVLVWAPPREALAEVMMYYGWGDCFSPALYLGAREYVIRPEVSYHSIVKAAPVEMRHSLADLVVLEERGAFLDTMYRELTGPTAPTAMPNLVAIDKGSSGQFEQDHGLTFRFFFTLPDSLAAAQKERFHVVEMASLFEFLFERPQGREGVAAVWGPGTLSTALARYDRDLSLDELNRLWQEEIEAAGDAADVEPARVAGHLLEGGFGEEAFAIAQTWTPSDRSLDSESRALAARCALAVGKLPEAAAWVATLDEEIRPEYAALLACFANWERRETDEIVVLAAAEQIEDALARVREGYGWLCSRTGTSLRESSGVRPIFFVYEDDASRSVGSQLAFANPTTTCSAHLVLGGSWWLDLTEAWLPRLWGWWPASPLVRLGVVTALVEPTEDLVRWGSAIACANTWRPIGGLSINSADDHLLRTETGLLVSAVESIGGLDAVKRFWTIGRERGRISLELTLREVVGMTTAAIEEHILENVLNCD